MVRLLCGIVQSKNSVGLTEGSIVGLAAAFQTAHKKPSPKFEIHIRLVYDKT